MGIINAKGMAEIQEQIELRNQKLESLIKEPYANKDVQNKALQKYLDSFELSLNQMHLYEALQAGVRTWLYSCGVARFFRFPDFVNSFLTTCLCLGTAAMILERYSKKDFYEQVNEMKTLYNWTLKNNKNYYSPEINNDTNLDSPHIKRLIKLLAPVCTTDFMIAWPKVSNKPEEASSPWSKTLSAGASAVTSTLSMFSNNIRPAIDQKQITELKISVETNKLQMNTVSKVEQAIKYFSTNLYVREVLATELKNLAKQELPSPIYKFVPPVLEYIHPTSP